MKKELLIIACITLLSVVPYSCSQKRADFVYTSSSGYVDIFRLSGENKRGAILILGSEGCFACDGLLSDVNRDEDFKNEIAKDYIVGRLNLESPDAQWIFQLLEQIAYPTFLIFDENQHFAGYIAGYKNKEEFRLILQEINQGNSQVSDVNVSSLLYPSTKANLLLAFDKVFESQRLNLNAKGTDEKVSFEIRDLLLQSLNIYPGIYTHYLLAFAYNNTNDSLKCKQIAAQTLDSCLAHPDKLALISLKLDLKKLINPNYNYRDDAFFEEDKSKTQLGDVPFGKTARIIIPFINGGKENLLVSGIHADCSCTKVVFSTDTIIPGAKGKIEVSITPKEKGNFHHSLMIVSNAINSPHYVTVSGNAK